MKNMIKWSLLLGITASVFAVSSDERLDLLEKEMQEVGIENIDGTYGAYLTNARPEVNGKGVFITMDALFWRAQVGGTEYAYSSANQINPTFPLSGTFPLKGSVKDIDFKWGWGLRAGLGYNFKCNGWDTHLEYTWYDTSGSDSHTAGRNSTVIPLRSASTITGNANNVANSVFVFSHAAKSQFDFNYQTLDLELARNYFVSGMLSLRPHIGLKGAWINLEQIARYYGGDLISVVGADVLGLGINTVKIKDNCDFKGVGPRAGVDTKWFIGHGFSLFSNVAAALLWGHYDVGHKEKFSQLANNRIRLGADMNRFSPTMQLQIGLAYDTYVMDDTAHISLGISFDVNYWWRMNQMLKDDSNLIGGPNTLLPPKYERYSEDVSLRGATIDLKIDF